MRRAVQLAIGRRYAARYGILAGPRRHRLLWPWVLTVAAATWAVVYFELPLRVGFRLSRPALDRLADEAMADPANAPRLAGRWAGIYWVAGVEVIGPTVVLYVGQDRGKYAFARVPGATADLIFNMPGLEDNPHSFRDFPTHTGSNDPEGMRIAGDWFVVYSAYWRAKVGWS